MTVRDRFQLQRMLETTARYQRRSALPDKRSVAAPATELSGINLSEPKHHFAQRVKQLVSDGLTQQAAEDCVKNLILNREKESGATVGATVRIDALAPGQRFRVDVPNAQGKVVSSLTGCLLYATPGRARVLLDAGPKQERSFTTRNGENVVINGAGRAERNYAPETPVAVLQGREEVSALLSSGDEVQSVKSSKFKSKQADPVNTAAAENEEDMANKKKSTKKGATKAAAPAKSGKSNGTVRMSITAEQVLAAGTKKVRESSVKGEILAAIGRVKNPTYAAVLASFTNAVKGADEAEFRKHLFPAIKQDIVKMA
jgi:hypothetical protein